MVNYVWKKPEATHVWDELIPLAADYGDTTRQKKKEKKNTVQNNPITTIWLV